MLVPVYLARVGCRKDVCNPYLEGQSGTTAGMAHTWDVDSSFSHEIWYASGLVLPTYGAPLAKLTHAHPGLALGPGMGQSIIHWYQVGVGRGGGLWLVFSGSERCQLRDCGCLTSPRGPRCLPLQVPQVCKSSHHRRDYCDDSEGQSFWRPGSSYPTGTCSTRHQPASPLIPYHLWTAWGCKEQAGAEEGLEDRVPCSRDRSRPQPQTR